MCILLLLLTARIYQIISKLKRRWCMYGIRKKFEDGCTLFERSSSSQSCYKEKLAVPTCMSRKAQPEKLTAPR